MFPEIDGGRFPVKRVVGETVVVEADVFGDGHDTVACAVLWRREDEGEWHRAPMEPLGNDRWRGSFQVTEEGLCRYTVQGWVDRFGTWRNDLVKRADAGQELEVPLAVGVRLVEEASERATGKTGEVLREWAGRIRGDAVTPRPSRALRGPQDGAPGNASPKRAEARATNGRGGSDARYLAATDERLAQLMAAHADLRTASRYERELVVEVDRAKAGCSAWYEMFPRSAAPRASRASANPGHGTFKDVEARLPYVAEMGFDVLYLPPIHPIGEAYRKGKNNSTTVKPGGPGSPWGIGSSAGGHKAVHPELGALTDFRRLASKAAGFGIEVALDIAFQCSPDHPYVREHPEWFRHRPDGSIQYAENPPKKYEDIYPFDFETPQWRELWEELRSVFLFWCEQGVHIFRVDNPHTKPFRFWEWVIAEVRREHPGTIFLAEAFTRPKVMYRLAKLGFTQSYTYFAWRNNKQELMEYALEVTGDPVRQFFRPNFWPNTPDILTEPMQRGGRPTFMVRLVLAATMSANYGIYGPAFEQMENTAREARSEEYLNSEKYEVKYWDLKRADSLSGFIGLVNKARRENPSLQRNDGLVFHGVDNDQLICYSKGDVLVVVNLDPVYVQSGWTDLSGFDGPYVVHDLLTDVRYEWSGPRNYVELRPREIPAHIFRIERS